MDQKKVPTSLEKMGGPDKPPGAPSDTPAQQHPIQPSSGHPASQGSYQALGNVSFGNPEPMMNTGMNMYPPHPYSFGPSYYPPPPPPPSLYPSEGLSEVYFSQSYVQQGRVHQHFSYQSYPQRPQYYQIPPSYNTLQLQGPVAPQGSLYNYCQPQIDSSLAYPTAPVKPEERVEDSVRSSSYNPPETPQSLPDLHNSDDAYNDVLTPESHPQSDDDDNDEKGAKSAVTCTPKMPTASKCSKPGTSIATRSRTKTAGGLSTDVGNDGNIEVDGTMCKRRDNVSNKRKAKKMPVGGRSKKKKNNKMMKNMDPMQECKDLLDLLLSKKTLAKPFLKPVTKKMAPNYKDVIKNPMDLGTINRKLKNKSYNSWMEFANDVRLVFSNCHEFNQPHEQVYTQGSQLKELFEELFAKILKDHNVKEGNTVDDERDSSSDLGLQEEVDDDAESSLICTDEDDEEKEQQVVLNPPHKDGENSPWPKVRIERLPEEGLRLSVSEECKIAYEEFKDKQKRFLMLAITNALQITVESSGSREAPFDDFVQAIKEAARIGECRYGLVNFDYVNVSKDNKKLHKNSLVLVLLSLDSAKEQEKLLYSSNLDLIRRSFVGIQKNIEIKSTSDLEINAFTDEVRKIEAQVGDHCPFNYYDFYSILNACKTTVVCERPGCNKAHNYLMWKSDYRIMWRCMKCGGMVKCLFDVSFLPEDVAKKVEKFAKRKMTDAPTTTPIPDSSTTPLSPVSPTTPSRTTLGVMKSGVLKVLQKQSVGIAVVENKPLPASLNQGQEISDGPLVDRKRVVEIKTLEFKRDVEKENKFYEMFKKLVSPEPQCLPQDMLKRHLISKGFSTALAMKISGSVSNKVEGKVLNSFESVKSAIQIALKETLSTVVKNIDILGNIEEAEEKGKIFAITFSGGESVEIALVMAKICFWLNENNLRVSICYTSSDANNFEKFRPHVKNLNALHAPQNNGESSTMVDFKDEGCDSLKAAKLFGMDNESDVVLLALNGDSNSFEQLDKICLEEKPEVAVFVVKGVSGVEAEVQLNAFENGIVNFPSFNELTKGVIFTNFDTASEVKDVGPALSFGFAGGRLPVLMGIGKNYKDLRKLDENGVVAFLMN